MMFTEKIYWDERYKNDGNSGEGSYGEYSNYKSKVINEFIKDKNIKSLFDYGCGDCNQLLTLNLSEVNYCGSDISDIMIDKLSEKYKDHSNFKFIKYNEVTLQSKVELAISLDVIYHIVNDGVYNEYINNLKNASEKYLIVYSSNQVIETYAEHIKHRVFLDDIIKNNEFVLVGIIKNIHDLHADFYFFERV